VLAEGDAVSDASGVALELGDGVGVSGETLGVGVGVAVGVRVNVAVGLTDSE
jgi:hypothetical protein